LLSISDYAQLSRLTKASTWHKTFVWNVFLRGPYTYFEKYNRRYFTSLCNIISTLLVAFYRTYSRYGLLLAQGRIVLNIYRYLCASSSASHSDLALTNMCRNHDCWTDVRVLL
jgi:hypothetical protein